MGIHGRMRRRNPLGVELKWYEGEGSPKVGEPPPMLENKDPHALEGAQEEEVVSHHQTSEGDHYWVGLGCQSSSPQLKRKLKGNWSMPCT